MFTRMEVDCLHPEAEPKKAYVTRCLEGRQGPAIAATDYVRAFADQIRAFVPMKYTVPGTDGFGRSDTRANLRRFFEVDRYYIAHAAIAALAAEGKMGRMWRGRSSSTRLIRRSRTLSSFGLRCIR